MVQAPTPKAPAQAAAPAYKGTAPPPPPELYHGRGATVEHVIDGKPVYYYKIKYHRDLRKCKTVGSPVAADFQKLYRKLKAVDPSLLLIPLNDGALAPGYQDKSKFPYIDRPVEIPVTSASEFKNYLSYTIEREQINGVFVLRTIKLLWTIKEDAGVR